MLDVTASTNHRMKTEASKQLGKKTLVVLLEQIKWNVTFQDVPIVTDALGTVSKTLEPRLDGLDI